MRTLMEKLIAISSLLDDLADLSEKKKQVVIQGDAEGLEKLLREETGLLARMKQAEEERQRAAMLFAIEKGMPAMGVTIGKLLEACSPSESLLLSRMQKELLEKAESLSRLNDTNRQLLQTQMDIAQYVLESSTRPTQLGVQYSGTGKDLDTQDPVNLFDRQA